MKTPAKEVLLRLPCCWLLSAVLPLFITGCGNGSAVVDTPEVDAVAAGNTTFALTLYQSLKDQPGNLFFSPYSISTALSMTLAGARGGTEKELAGMLHLELPRERLHPAMGSLDAWLLKAGNRNQLTLVLANSLWYQQDHPFTEDYSKLIRGSYRAAAYPVDFEKASGRALGDINSWVTDKTRGLVKEAGLGSLDTTARLVLCNAIYFKGAWEKEFDPKDTRTGPFRVTTNRSVNVPLMHGYLKGRAMERDGLKALELPYKGGDMSLIILLPGTVDGLPELESRLCETNLQAWQLELFASPRHEKAVTLPRFKTSQTLDLKTKLEPLGLTSAFNPATADFSGMDGSRRLFLSRVVHQAFVEVDEVGTKAAAVTSSAMECSAATEPFVADHPFLFLIRENHTGSILFLGRMIDPTE